MMSTDNRCTADPHESWMYMVEAGNRDLRLDASFTGSDERTNRDGIVINAPNSNQNGHGHPTLLAIATEEILYAPTRDVHSARQSVASFFSSDTSDTTADSFRNEPGLREQSSSDPQLAEHGDLNIVDSPRFQSRPASESGDPMSATNLHLEDVSPWESRENLLLNVLDEVGKLVNEKNGTTCWDDPFSHE